MTRLDPSHRVRSAGLRGRGRFLSCRLLLTAAGLFACVAGLGPAASAGAPATPAAAWAAAGGFGSSEWREVPAEARTAIAAEVAGTSAAQSEACPGGVCKAFLPLVLRSSQPALLPPRNLFGIQIYNSDAAVADRVAQSGAGWIRIPFEWRWVEPLGDVPPGQYVWPTWFDNMLAPYSLSNVQIILTFQGNPTWAADYLAGPVHAEDLPALAEFIQAAVAHYAAPPYKVRYWEFYNEPDNALESRAVGGGWGYFGDEPQAYVDLLSWVYPAMKAAQPDVKVLMGGLAYDGWTSGFQQYFLDNVLEYGGAAYLDMVNFHYYANFESQWIGYGYGPDILGKVGYIRSVLAAHGVSKPLICTETATWSNQGSNTDEQARYVPQVMTRALSVDIGGMIWFQLLDYVEAYHMTGLLNPDMTPKPAYTAFQVLANQVDSATYQGSVCEPVPNCGELEAYRFLQASDGTQITVAWTNDDAHLYTDMAFAAQEVTVVGKLGETSIVSDDDGDGWVHVTITPSPQYIRVASGP